MSSAGDAFLQGVLGQRSGEHPGFTGETAGAIGRPGGPASPDNPYKGYNPNKTEEDIRRQAREAREGEMRRVDQGPPSPWEVFGNDTEGPKGMSGGSVGYKFDPETTAKKITEWEQLRSAIESDALKLQTAANVVKPPSGDMPAHQQVEATRSSILAALDHNRKMWQYAQAYIDALRKSNGTYTQREEDVAGGLYGTSSGADGLYG
ncbi:hypothetical protein [Amycolatopsis anabasis]|uniref:hypothetical protein n=1 Tax=Amycolatopsis anabasis TaxID=1840409 RepID=UPI00131CFAA5|nr:hypothetical protein [Amycolatopsis anabasis]